MGRKRQNSFAEGVKTPYQVLSSYTNYDDVISSVVSLVDRVVVAESAHLAELMIGRRDCDTVRQVEL